jgi:hypothetical protein
MQPMIALVCVLVLVVVAYWILRPRPAPPTPTCVSARGAPGTCDTDSDCNAPNGACQKNSEGACVCVCAPGYSGAKCQTKGIPYNSYQCMGPNKVPPNPPPGNKNGMCVCPPGSWASGIDPTTGQWVQCLGCAEGWGPLGASNACTLQWKNGAVIYTNNCYQANFGEACSAEFGQFASQTGPNGEKGGASYQGEFCAATSPSGNPSCSACTAAGGSTQVGCTVSGWLNPNYPPVNCDQQRKCSSYSCLV